MLGARYLLTDIVLDRLLQIYGELQEGPNGEKRREIDFQEFVTLTLAVENLYESEYNRLPATINYFWRVLDMDFSGQLSVPAITLFLREIIEGSADYFKDTGPLGLENVLNEILAMISPRDTQYITLKDLHRCKMGWQVLSMLVDVNGIIRYETKQMQGPGEDEDDDEAVFRM